MNLLFFSLSDLLDPSLFKVAFSVYSASLQMNKYSPYCHRSGFPLFHSCKTPAQTYSFLIVIQVLVYTDFHEFTQVYTNLHEFQILFTRLHFLFHRASVQTKTCEYSGCVLLFFGFPVEFLNKCTEFRLNLNLK